MLRRPLFIVAVLFGLDYLAWLWSLGGSHGTIGLIAGPLLVLLGVSLAWLVVKQVARAVTGSGRAVRSAERARRQRHDPEGLRYREAQSATSAPPQSGAAPGYGEQTTGAAGSSSSAQIAA